MDKGAAMVGLRPPTINTAVAKLCVNKLYAVRYRPEWWKPEFPQDYRFQGYELVIEKWTDVHVIAITSLEATKLAQSGIPIHNRII